MDPFTLIRCAFRNNKENDSVSKNGYINKMFRILSRKLNKKDKKQSLNDEIIK